MRECFALWKKGAILLNGRRNKKMEFDVDFLTDYNIAI